ncbi:histidine phosphatase family protein, partial [Streptomyces albidoflavus]|uniref:histidine phosphatase family protein n=1 Tax=Streptomyces albidoflavus TaxID=1886 RepID=UPI00332392F5
MARPQRIVLVRHGESVGNADDSVYEREPDHALRLTARGLRQARETGAELREVFGQEPAGAKGTAVLRPHRIAIGSYDLDDAGRLVRT